MFQDQQNHTGIITSAYSAIIVTITTLCTLDVLSPLSCYFSLPLILRGQVWRLFTHLFYFGSSFSIEFLLHLLFLINHCHALETSSYRGRRADFVYLLMFGGVMMTLIAAIFNVMIMSSAFVFVLTYIWSRRNPDTQMSFFGIITFRAPYLPWILLLFSVVSGSDLFTDLVGLIVGHIYYYLEDVYPYMTPTRVRLLRTPWIISYIFDEKTTEGSTSQSGENVTTNGVDQAGQADPTVIQRNLRRAAELRAENLLRQLESLDGTTPATTTTTTASATPTIAPNTSTTTQSVQNTPTVNSSQPNTSTSSISSLTVGSSGVTSLSEVVDNTIDHDDDLYSSPNDLYQSDGKVDANNVVSAQVIDMQTSATTSSTNDQHTSLEDEDDDDDLYSPSAIDLYTNQDEGLRQRRQ